MKVYITKYALTRGILELDAKDISKSSCTIINKNGWRTYYDGKEWHQTMEDAKLDANSRRIRKIASLKKQLAKLEEMKF